MQTNFQRIILGATTTGLGAFLNEPEESLLIEASSMIGPDFAGCFNPGSASGNMVNVEATNLLFAEATKIGVLKNGFVHLPGLQTLLYKHLIPFAKNILLLTDYLSAATVDGKIAVTVFNKNGTTVYTCEELIDATPALITNQMKTEILSVSLGCVFVATKEESILPNPKYGKLMPTCFPNEFYFQLPLTKEDSWAQARNNLLKFIVENKETFEGWALAATAIEKRVKASDKYKGLASILNTSNYDGIVEGFTAGFQFINNRKALV